MDKIADALHQFIAERVDVIRQHVRLVFSEYEVDMQQSSRYIAQRAFEERVPAVGTASMT